MNLKKKKMGKKHYFYLEHSLRDKGKVVKKEQYIGSTLPDNLDELKNNFMYALMKEKYFDCFDKIKQNFSAEIKSMSPSAKEKYLNYFLIKFTYDTNRIEGSTITLKETAKILEQGITPQNKPINDIKETEAHKLVFNDMVHFKKDLSLQIIFQWHRMLLEKTKPDIAGKVRRIQIKVAGSKTEFPLAAELDVLLQEFIAWYNSNKNKLHPLELASMAHLKFVSIHPFVDGNGRISRLLMNFVLHKLGYPMLNIKYTHRDSYYNALERAQTTHLDKILVLHIFRRYLKEYKKYL